MRRRTGILLGIALVLAVVAIYAYREFHRTNTNLAEVKADVTVGAVPLVNEFLANDSVANVKYQNKILAVQGVVKEVTTSEGDCTVVMGDTTGMSSSVRCLLDSAQAAFVGNIRRGDVITIKGAITGFKKDETGLLGSDVELNRCVLDSKQ
ncbi:OB-fold protein [Paraflavitalea pollutisoli]|uniref:OB-fold protein n=1 Tax=Paraflavitalea pollutisoli TaxID=3034143 RepID=UPI0023EB5638|nr:hypothetical protein [Paraflavitalea sp. H1-2-19X]